MRTGLPLTNNSLSCYLGSSVASERLRDDAERVLHPVTRSEGLGLPRDAVLPFDALQALQALPCSEHVGCLNIVQRQRNMVMREALARDSIHASSSEDEVDTVKRSACLGVEPLCFRKQTPGETADRQALARPPPTSHSGRPSSPWGQTSETSPPRAWLGRRCNLCKCVQVL